MSVDFGRIKRRTLRQIRNRFAYATGVFYATGQLLAGRARHLITTLKNTADELKIETDEIVGKSQRRLLFVTIGQAISAWATMEEALVYILALLLGTEPEKSGLILYSTINFSVWISIIDELFAIDDHFSAFKPRWNKIAARLRSLKDDRDRIAHHAVREEEEIIPFTGSVIRPGRMDLRRKSIKRNPMDNDDVLAFSEAVNKLAEDLISLTQAMIAKQRLASPEKSAE